MQDQFKSAVFQFALRLGDDRLVLGHRLSEWCGHAPVLEEDIAMANIALDLVGQAQGFLEYAGQVEGKGRDADALAYFRPETGFCSVQLVEQPNGDFARTIARQFLFDAFDVQLLDALRNSSDKQLADLAAKYLKESSYHLRHSGQWVLRLGDGTAESRQRIQTAFEDLWMFTAELFEEDEIHRMLVQRKVAPELGVLRPGWEQLVKRTLGEATLKLPDYSGYMATGSRLGRHSEHLGHMLAEMQSVARAFPGASW